MGFLFFNLSNDQSGIQNRLGVLFFVAVNQTFGVIMPTIAVIPLQRNIIKRERSAGTYRASSAYLAKLLSSLPLTYVAALIVTVPLYWMVGFQVRDLSLTFENDSIVNRTILKNT
jgi:ABC-type multidrug transport system permease subunit